MTMRLNNGNRNAGLDAIDASLNAGGAGTIKIYTGAVNGTFGSAPAGSLITTITFGVTAFAAAANGSMASNTLASGGDGSAAPSALVAGCFTITAGDGTTIVLDGSVTSTGGGGDLILTDVNVGNGVVISIPNVTLTAGNSPS